MPKLLPTTVIGSYPQPDWLIDREKLRGSLPPRVRARELWRVDEPFLAQAQDDATELAMDLAVAVNEEVRDLFAAGADIVQIDEPWLQSRADKAREFALPAIDRALRDVPGTTALHTCFGYAAVVHDKPDGYPFLAELGGCAVDILAIEAAQSRLDPAVLQPIAHKTVV